MKYQALLGFLSILLFITACDPLAIDVTTEDPDVADTLRAQPIDEDAIRVGVLAIRSASAANAQYGGLIAYLEEELGRPVLLVPVTQEEQFQFVANGDLDFTLNNPLAGVQIQRLYQYQVFGNTESPKYGNPI